MFGPISFDTDLASPVPACGSSADKRFLTVSQGRLAVIKFDGVGRNTSLRFRQNGTTWLEMSDEPTNCSRHHETFRGYLEECELWLTGLPATNDLRSVEAGGD